LARALLKAGNRVTVWNRTPEKAEALAAEGALVAGTAANALAASDVSIVCVTDHAATMEILSGVRAGGSERTLVQLTTMSSDESRELATWARDQGTDYLDGSIFGVPATVRQGKATIVLSGPADLFDANRELLQALGTPMHLSPQIGAAVSFDRVWYAYAFTLSMAVMQGAAMAHASGLSKRVFFDLVEARTPIILDQLMRLGEKIEARDYTTSDARLDVWADSFVEALALCREKGVDDSLPAAVMSNFQRARAAGFGDRDLAAVFEVLIGQEAA
jgi:3-hydroxyisobutyrate dehydrogenase-like beta-hydroxyacid dehydrogenase